MVTPTRTSIHPTPHTADKPLHRIHSAKASTFNFERPYVDLARYDAVGRFAIDKVPGKHLLESRLSEDQTHTETDTGNHINATVVQTLLLNR